MEESLLKKIVLKHSPHARSAPLFQWNAQVMRPLRKMLHIKTYQSMDPGSEALIVAELKNLSKVLEAVAEPSLVCPMETALVLRLVHWDLHDYCISVRSIKGSEGKRVVAGVELNLKRGSSRISGEAAETAKRIAGLVRFVKFVPCLHGELFFNNQMDSGAQLKWLTLATGMGLSFLFSFKSGSLQPLVLGTFLSAVAFVIVAVTSTVGDADDAPGGFNSLFGFLPEKSREETKQSYMNSWKRILKDYKWQRPSSPEELKEFKTKCFKKIFELSEPAVRQLVSE